MQLIIVTTLAGNTRHKLAGPYRPLLPGDKPEPTIRYQPALCGYAPVKHAWSTAKADDPNNACEGCMDGCVALLQAENAGFELKQNLFANIGFYFVPEGDRDDSPNTFATAVEAWEYMKSCQGIEDEKPKAEPAPSLLEACEQARHWLDEEAQVTSAYPHEILRVLNAAIEAAKAPPKLVDTVEGLLIDVYQRWMRDNGREGGDADELLRSALLTHEQTEWLQVYTLLWNMAMQSTARATGLRDARVRS